MRPDFLGSGGQLMIADVQAATALATPVERSTTAEPEAPRQTLALWIVCVSHALNHMQSGIFSVLYASMMESLGFNYGQLALMLTVNNLVSNAMQAVYGFITKYFKRAVILGAGYIVMGLATFRVAGAQNFSPLVPLVVRPAA